MTDPAAPSVVFVEHVLWEPGAAWSEALEHVAGRFARVKALDVEQVRAAGALHEQLEYLVEMAQRPHVTVQIVPLDVTNASAPAIPITYLRFGGVDLPDIVYLEHIKSAAFLEDRDERTG